jgi:hypothetical protein
MSLTFGVNGRFLLKCMNSNPECDETFTEAEILRFVDGKSYAALDRLRTEDEIQTVLFTSDIIDVGEYRRAREMSIL